MGVISDERFVALTSEYDAEQKALMAQAEMLDFKLQRKKDDAADISEFHQIIRNYTEMTKLTAPLLHELIDRIVVYNGQGRGSNRTQRVEVYFKLIGLLPDYISDHCASR